MNALFDLLKRYRDIIAYVFFGVCTTCVNVATYYLFHELLGVRNIPATVIAWVVAVFFAFVTNKLYVFNSKSFNRKVFLWELSTFYSCRLLTGISDLAIMYTAVDVLALNPTLWKAVSDLIAIVFNYIASKFLVFTKK